MKKEKLIFLKPKKGDSMGQWLVEQGISAGFPSPADDFKEIRISLDRELVKNSESTFYARVNGNSMIDAGISDGDMIVIDRSLMAENNKIAVCFLDGEFTVKRIVKRAKKLFLKPENSNYKEIEIEMTGQKEIYELRCIFLAVRSSAFMGGSVTVFATAVCSFVTFLEDRRAIDLAILD